jgi:PAS domain S-box-containing protein
VTSCLKGNSGLIEAPDYRGVPSIIVYRWLPEHRLCLIVKLEEAEAYAPAQAFGSTVAGISVLTLLAAAVLARVLARSLTRPILRLQDGVIRFRRGDLQTELSVHSSDELGVLAREFNQMAAALLEKDAQLRAHTQMLEEKVEARTRALQQTLSQLQRAEQIGQVGSWEWLIAANRVSWTDGLYKVFGLVPQEFGATYEAYLERVHPEDREYVRHTINQAFHAGGMFEFESRILRKDGEARSLSTRGEMSFAEDGSPLRMTGIAVDITDRKQVEEILRESEDKFKYVFDNSMIGKSITFPDGTLNVNKAFCSMLGYSEEELKSKKWQEITHPEDIEASSQAIAPILAGEKDSARFTKRYLHKDGSIVWTDVSTVLRRDKEGKPVYFMTALLDITERKHAEQALQLENARFMRFVNSNIIGIVIADATGKIILANDYYLNILGVTREGFLGGNVDWRKFTPPEWLPADEKAIAELREGGICEPYEKEYVREDGTRVPVYIADAMLPGPEEHIAAFILDITERKRAEEAVQRITDDLLRSNAELEQFAYVASHDLQEPLRMVSSYVQLLARRYQGKLDSDADEFIGFAVDGAKRMQNLINDLLAYSRVGTRGSGFMPVSAEFLLEEAKANLQLTIEESGARITQDALPVVHGDPVQLASVFQNLLGNAIKFHGSEPPCIHISAQQEAEHWIFSVRDNGMGIDPQFAERIFIIFQRLNDRTRYPGTGIGLAICKRIILRHGGRIWVQSEPGQGAVFYFTLPVVNTK